MLLEMILALTPDRPEALQPPPSPPKQFVRYVTTWRTRYAIDGKEVDWTEFKAACQEAGGLELVEMRLGGDGWQVRWLIFTRRK